MHSVIKLLENIDGIRMGTNKVTSAVWEEKKPGLIYM